MRNGQNTLQMLLAGLAQSVEGPWYRFANINKYLQMSVDEGIEETLLAYRCLSSRYGCLHDGDSYGLSLERAIMKAAYAVFIKMSHNDKARFRFPDIIENILAGRQSLAFSRSFSKYSLAPVLEKWADKILKGENEILNDD